MDSAKIQTPSASMSTFTSYRSGFTVDLSMPKEFGSRLGVLRRSYREGKRRSGDDFSSSCVRDAEGEVDQARCRVAGGGGHNDLIPLDLLFEDGTGVDAPVRQGLRGARCHQRAEGDQDADEKKRGSRIQQKMGRREQNRDRLSVAQARYNCDLFKGLAAVGAAASSCTCLMVALMSM